MSNSICCDKKKKKTVVHLLCTSKGHRTAKVIGIIAKIKQDSYYCSCFEYLLAFSKVVTAKN